jgi:uncharacterized cupin superfamily protein
MTDERDFHPISSESVPWQESSHGERFYMRYRNLAEHVFGGRSYNVGVAIEELPAGKRTVPVHYHMLEEEHVLVLEGELTLTLGDETFVMKAGDYAAFPAGRKVGHGFANGGATVCRYVIIGENNPNDVCVYPQENKVGVRWLGERYSRKNPMEYWEGVKED